MVFKFKAPTSSSDLTFGSSTTPSGRVFTFGQTPHPSNNNNDDSGLSNMMSTLNVNDDNQNTTADTSNNDNDNNNNIISSGDVCANCGKGEEAGINLKSCAACKFVKYCSRDCQIAHRPQHKKACKKRAAELRDIELFKQPPQLDDCPICFIRLPTYVIGRTYMSCCGKVICTGCIYASQSRATSKGKKDVCPFCRTRPSKSDEECDIKMKKRMEADDPIAIYEIGKYYSNGTNGFAQDYTKALELWHKAGELGHVEAYHTIGYAYKHGNGVEMDKEKALYYTELAAMGGDADARFSLADSEGSVGNFGRAMKHMIIAIEGGHSTALEMIQRMYKNGLATKTDFEKALRARQAYLDEIKSEQRDEALGLRCYDR